MCGSATSRRRSACCGRSSSHSPARSSSRWSSGRLGRGAEWRRAVPWFAFADLAVWTYFSARVDAHDEQPREQRVAGHQGVLPAPVAAPLSALLPGLIDLAVALASLTVVLVVVGGTTGPSDPDPAVLDGGDDRRRRRAGPAAGHASTSATATSITRSAFVIQLWLFVSPVALPVRPSSHGDWRYVYAPQPDGRAILDGFRWAMLGTPRPPGSLRVRSAAAAARSWAGARLLPSAASRRFADVV